MPTISIIVPVYKVEPYLRRCVDSILMQTFTDFELILVDDGSPDNCGKICDEYAENDSRIRVIHQENGGLSAARNAGLDIARGKYILFCDSDDYVANNWCESFIQKTTINEDNYIFGGMNTVVVTELRETVYPPNVFSQPEWSVSDYLYLQLHGIVGFACNVLYYSQIIQKYSLRFSSDVIVEDLPFNFLYLQYINSLSYTGEAGYYYVHDSRETLSRKYYPNLFLKWKQKYQATQQFIAQVLPKDTHEDNIKIVANKYLYLFLNVLNNTFDARNRVNWASKMSYNVSVVKDPIFQHCLRYADCKQEDNRIIWLLKKRCYIGVYLLQKASYYKSKIKKKR